MATIRILAQINIGKTNTQWVNAGSGIWWLNIGAVYANIDSTLLPSSEFFAQSISSIGSVQIDSVIYASTNTLADVTTNAQSFFYDGSSNLYIHVINNDEIFLHTVDLGVIFAYSFDSFTPVGSMQLYEGRLIGTPSISKSRDPLFFGKLQFEGGTITLDNSDGFFDKFVEDNAVYGFNATVLWGYDTDNIVDYHQIFNGYMEKVSVNENQIQIGITDKRKQLSKAITYSCTAKNALDAIVEILTTAYTNVSFSSAYFDVDQWNLMRSQVDTVTIAMTDPDDVINVIQGICASVFGIFIITPTDKYSFKIVDTSLNGTTLIPDSDILNAKTFSYDPTEVLSSIRVGYNKNWATTNNPFTWYTNSSFESAVFTKYKTYAQRDFETYLPTLAEATALSSVIISYVKDVHATTSLEVPITYHENDLTDMIFAELKRQTSDIFGIKKCEVIRVTYNLDRNTITFGLRKYDQTLYYLVNENGVYLNGDDGFVVGVQ